MTVDCRDCDAKCCRYFCFEIDAPDDFNEFEDLRWYLCHEGVSLHIEDGDWYIALANPCKMLGDDNRCRIYDERPMICREYDMGNCDRAEGEYEHDEEFHTPEELEAYARRTLGDKAYDEAQREARQKAARRQRNRQRKRLQKLRHEGKHVMEASRAHEKS